MILNRSAVALGDALNLSGVVCIRDSQDQPSIFTQESRVLKTFQLVLIFEFFAREELLHYFPSRKEEKSEAAEKGNHTTNTNQIMPKNLWRGP